MPFFLDVLKAVSAAFVITTAAAGAVLLILFPLIALRERILDRRRGMRLHRESERGLWREMRHSVVLTQQERHPSIVNDPRNRRAVALLRDWLSPAQRKQFDAHMAFEVTGGKSGRTYVIIWGTTFNVLLIGTGTRLDLVDMRLCFRPFADSLPIPDIMLAQKLALELFETDVLRVACTDGNQPPCLRCVVRR